MGRFRLCMVTWGLIIAAGSPIAAPAATPQSAAETPLPVQRVVLYKSGIGYFEHLGEVIGDRDLTISFTSAQLDDVLKTLTVLDLDGGRVTDIGYNSLAPIDQRLRNVRLPLGETPTLFDLMSALRGAPIEVRHETGNVSGRVLSAERHTRVDGDATRATEEVSIVTDDGEVHRFEFGSDVSIRLLDEDLRQEMSRYLTLLESTREEDVRRLTISTRGSGERSLFVSYVSEVPIWKSSYRIVMPAQPGGTPILQGWAIVDNTVGEDWENVELSLVGGAPQSFIQQISQPYYARRPVVPLPEYAQRSPQTHDATLAPGGGRIVGAVFDPDGAMLPGVLVTAVGADGDVAGSTYTGVSGEYSLGPLPAGAYRLRFNLDGFRPRTSSTTVRGGQEITRNVSLALAAVEETVTVASASPEAGNWEAGYADAAPARASLDERVARGLEAQQAVAGSGELGDLFEYRITDPVTIRRNQSALVPILRAEVSAEKVSLWSGGTGTGRPLRALWLTNASDLSLAGGTFTVLEDSTFVGEGLLESMEPGEKRLLSYGTDVAMLVEGEIDAERGTVTRVTAQDGVLIYETEARQSRTYMFRNEDSEQRTVIVEHPQRLGWEIISEALPEERASGMYRFRVVVEPRQSATLLVAESQPIATRVSLSAITDNHIELLVQENVSREVLEQALRPILDKKSEIAAAEREIQARRSETTLIEQDQERVRENITALGGSSEERDLVARYVRQLSEQEDRLEELRREISEHDDRRDVLRGELQVLIGNLTFEIDARR